MYGKSKFYVLFCKTPLGNISLIHAVSHRVTVPSLSVWNNEMITAPKSAWRYSHERLNSLLPEFHFRTGRKWEEIILAEGKSSCFYTRRKCILKKKISLAVSNVNKRKGKKWNKCRFLVGMNRDPAGSALSDIEEESQASLHIKNKTAYSKDLTTVASQYLIRRFKSFLF